MPLLLDDDGRVVGYRHDVPPGSRMVFWYPGATASAPGGYGDHSGQVVDVVRPLTVKECELGGQPMYRIRADDGWEGDAWEDELASPPGRCVTQEDLMIEGTVA